MRLFPHLSLHLCRRRRGCTALIYKHASIRKNPILELSIFVIFAYIPFLLGEWMQLSGIVAILFTGMSMKHYTYNNMSRERQESDALIAVLANIATAVFLDLGTSVWAFRRPRSA